MLLTCKLEEPAPLLWSLNLLPSLWGLCPCCFHCLDATPSDFHMTVSLSTFKFQSKCQHLGEASHDYLNRRTTMCDFSFSITSALSLQLRVMSLKICALLSVSLYLVACCRKSNSRAYICLSRRQESCGCIVQT